VQGQRLDAEVEHWSEALVELVTAVKNLGGTLSGEHGIGSVQKPYMSLMVGDTNLQLMRGIKQVFDPNNILNPGKIF
jgi:glycolate oxidase